jgi:hypothetical protein
MKIDFKKNPPDIGSHHEGDAGPARGLIYFFQTVKRK